MLKIKTIKEIESNRKKLKKVIDIKMYGQELMEEHDLSVPQAVSLLNGEFKDELKVLKRIKTDSEGNLIYKLDNGIEIQLNK